MPKRTTQVVQEMMRILEAQRIISLDTLFELADHLEAVAKGEKLEHRSWSTGWPAASPRSSCRARRSAGQREECPGLRLLDREAHRCRAQAQLRAAIEKAAGDPEKLKDTRALLAPLLRDTLVAYNYAHYAPPGAQILYTNPVFVRSHDFLGVQGTDHTWRPTETVRHRLALERRRPAGGLAVRPALRAGRGRAELPDSRRRPRR